MVWQKHHTSRKLIAAMAGSVALLLCATTAFCAGMLAASWHMEGMATLTVLLWLAFTGMSLVMIELAAVLATSPDGTLDLLGITEGEITPIALVFILAAALFVALAAPFSAEGRRSIVQWFGQAIAGGMVLAAVNAGLALALALSGAAGAGIGLAWGAVP